MGNSIEEDIKRIAKLITTKFNNDYSIDNVDKEAIEELLEAYKELKEIEESHRKENGELREKVKQMEEENETAKTITSQLMSDFINRNVIPVSLVKEKIEELKENGYWNYLEKRDLETTIEILQELLEKRK